MFNFSTATTAATRQQRPTLRGAAALLPALSILAAASLLTLSPVQAQVPQQLSQQTAAIDPPGRVARMNLAEGPVSYAPADTGGNPRWTPASLNRPLTSGDRLWTGQRARSELHIGSTAVRLSEQTSLDFLELDDDTTQLRLAQGTMKLRVRNVFEGQRIEINTPNLAFVITQPGDYRIDATPASNLSAGTTRVVVQQGAGTIYGDGGASVNIASGQQANFTDTQLTPAGPGAEVQDGFDAWAYQRDRLEDQSVTARYVPREVVGYQQLDSYGDWNQDPTYGAVWLPRAVPANWAPYREGHWSWIAPWGWTWVDDAPWGFAPFHYGRWAQIGPRWGWVPGRMAPRPVYAPALVAFIGGNAGGVNWNVSIGQQGPRPGLGWFPLAPGEAFRPAYRHSPRYVTNVNQNIVVNNVNVTNNYRYQRQGNAVSVMSAEDFARGQRVRPEGQRLNPADLGRAQLIAPERGGLPQRVANLRDLPRVASPAALPPAAVAVRPVVASQTQPGQRDDRRNDRREDRRDDRQNNPRDNARAGRPGDAPDLPRQPVPAAQAAQPGQPAIPQQGAAPDRGGLFDAEQRARAEQQRQQQERLQGQQGQQREQERQQRDLARQQDRAGGQRQPADESLGQRALREQAQRSANVNGTPNPAVPPVQPGRPDAGRDPIEQAQREQQRLQRDQQRQQIDTARQQEQQRRQADESIGQRALQEQAQRQQQAQRQAQDQQAQQAQQAQQRAQQDQARQQQAAEQQSQQAQQRAQQDQQRQAREQQQLQQQQRQQQDQARQAAQQQAQRQQAQEQQAQQAQQAQQRQQQMAQQQQQQLQQRAQQDQQRQARDQQQLIQQQQQRQQPEQPRAAVRERQPRPGEAVNGVPVDERGNRRRD
jgi:hypothetical protein